MFRSLLVFIFIFPALMSQSQDAHFSQFFANPMYLNPALAGAFNGTFRVNTIYRDQWGDGLDDPYATFAVSGDAKLDFSKKFDKGDYFAVGLLFFADRYGAYDFNTNIVSLSGAYHKLLQKHNNQFLSVGFQVGINQKNINYENLVFGDQFDGLNSFGNNTSEILPPNNFGLFDLGLGVNYSITFNSNTAIYLGGSMMHITEPNIAFFGQSDVVQPPFETENKLFRKYNGYIATSFPLAESFYLTPRALISLQGPYMEVVAGTGFKLEIPNSLSFWQFGLWARPVKDLEGFSLNDIIVQSGFQFNSFAIGLSYDINLTGLSNSNIYRSSFELSLSLIGKYENDDNICPQF